MNKRRLGYRLGMAFGLAALLLASPLGANQPPEPPPRPVEKKFHPWVEKKHEFSMNGQHWDKVFNMCGGGVFEVKKPERCTLLDTREEGIALGK